MKCSRCKTGDATHPAWGIPLCANCFAEWHERGPRVTNCPLMSAGAKVLDRYCAMYRDLTRQWVLTGAAPVVDFRIANQGAAT